MPVGTRLQLRTAAAEQCVHRRSHQSAIGGPRLQRLYLRLQIRDLLSGIRSGLICDVCFATRLIRRHALLITLGARCGNLPLSNIRFATRLGRDFLLHNNLPLSDVRLVSSRIQTGLITLRGDRHALILSVTSLGVRFRNIHSAVRQVDAVRDQVRICFRLLGQTHCGFCRRKRLWRAGRKVGDRTVTA